jgi:ankyrin repeat protein
MLTEPQGNQEPSAMLTMLVSRGADVNAKDQRGQTVLMQRLQKGVTPYFSTMADAVFLLEHGAIPALADEKGYTALHYFAGSGLAPLGAGGYDLAYTREINRVFGEVLRQLVARGAEVNAESRAHKTPLMLAAGSNCNPTRVAMLLKQGADPVAKDSTGKSAMDYALEQAIAFGASRFCNQVVALLKNPSMENAESFLRASGTAVVPAAAGGARSGAGDPNAARQAQQTLNVINSAASLLKAVGR